MRTTVFDMRSVTATLSSETQVTSNGPRFDGSVRNRLSEASLLHNSNRSCFQSRNNNFPLYMISHPETSNPRVFRNFILYTGRSLICSMPFILGSMICNCRLFPTIILRFFGLVSNSTSPKIGTRLAMADKISE